MTAGATARRDPALGAPLAWSVAGHLAAAAALVLVLREAAPVALPPSYAVSLVAAPPGPRREAMAPVAADAPTVPPATAPAPAAETPAKAERAEAPSPTGTIVAAPDRAKPKPVPAPAKPSSAKADTKATARGDAERAGAPTAATPAAPKTGPTTPAGGGPTGGRGNDVATVRTEGTAFPFPGYLANIVRQVALEFTPKGASALRADVAFTIQRDGSVSDIRLVTRSGNYAFDLECQGAVEAVGRRRGFGPLPTGFRDDALPVVFAFDPRTLR